MDAQHVTIGDDYHWAWLIPIYINQSWQKDIGLFKYERSRIVKSHWLLSTTICLKQTYASGHTFAAVRARVSSRPIECTE